jgi:nucleoside 2-deoxyribosyltransferase
MNRYYFGGELFSLKHLLGNVALAQAIQRVSAGKYEAVLPQDFEFTSKRGKAIRDVDILSLLSCDLALFHFDGLELDSGTVVEFMFAKFADIPTVLLRTDFRKAGDSPHDPWNLMLSDYPRTEKVILHGMEVYRAARSTGSSSEADSTNHATAQFALEGVASRVVEAFEKLLSTPPRLPAHLQGPVREWLSLMPNFIMESEEALDLIQKFSKSPSTGLTETEPSKHEH